MSRSTFEEELKEKGVLVYTNVGTSMRPLIRQGKDVMIIKSFDNCCKLKKMDVPLYKRENGQYVLHRIIKVTKDGYVIRGDNTYSNEYGVTDSQILGVLSGVIRNGKEISVNSLGYRVYSYFWLYTYYIRKVVVWMKRKNRLSKSTLQYLKDVTGNKKLYFLILMVVQTIFILIDLIFVLLLCFISKGVVSKIICILLAVVLSVGSGIGGYYISKTGGALNKITSVIKNAKNTVSIVVKQSSDIKDKKSLNGLTVGYLRNIGTAGSAAMFEDLSKSNIKMEQKQYDSMTAILEAFYNGEVDSIIINESSRSQILDMEAYSNFDSNTRVVYQTSFEVKNNDSAAAVSDITSKPFNVLISGSDTRGGFDENGRSDVIMVATVNPKTHTILLTSVPRDFYVTTACDAGDGCMQGALDKITHTGIHGTNTTKRTVEQLLGIEINYTFKVGFDTVTDLVDAIGGVDVNVAPGYAVDSFLMIPSFSVHEGVNHLNGQQALAYARERYAYT